MHRALRFLNIGQGANTIIVTNRGGHNNRKKCHSRLLNSIRISLVLWSSAMNIQKQYGAYFVRSGIQTRDPNHDSECNDVLDCSFMILLLRKSIFCLFHLHS